MIDLNAREAVKEVVKDHRGERSEGPVISTSSAVFLPFSCIVKAAVIYFYVNRD